MTSKGKSKNKKPWIKKMPQEIEKIYSELKKKHDLLDFKELDFELEISNIEQEKFVLREIVRRCAEKIDFCCKLLEEILQPDASNLYALHESRFFEEEERKKMYELYKKLMFLSRNSIEIILEGQEIKEAQFIKEFFRQWKSLKKEMFYFLAKMKDSWKNELNLKDEVGYLG